MRVGGEGGTMSAAQTPRWYHSLSCGTRRKDSLAGLVLPVCKMGTATLASVQREPEWRSFVHQRCSVSAACPCRLTASPALCCQHACCPLCPPPGRLWGHPALWEFLCHFLVELQVALKSARPFRGREVRAVQGM